jgi:hypothetical protein
MSAVNAAFEIVHHHIRRNPAKVREHPLLNPDKGRKFLIGNELPEGIRAEGQDPAKKLA